MKKTIKTIRSREDTLSTKTPGVYCTPRDRKKHRDPMQEIYEPVSQLEASALAECVMDAG